MERCFGSDLCPQHSQACTEGSQRPRGQTWTSCVMHERYIKYVLSYPDPCASITTSKTRFKLKILRLCRAWGQGVAVWGQGPQPPAPACLSLPARLCPFG